jgi:hypothetical protein
VKEESNLAVTLEFTSSATIFTGIQEVDIDPLWESAFLYSQLIEEFDDPMKGDYEY